MIYEVIEKIDFSANGLRITHTFEVGDTIDSDNVPPRLIHVFTKDTPRPFIIPEGASPPCIPEPKPEKDIHDEVEYLDKAREAINEVQEEMINEKIKPGKKGKDKTTKKKKAKRKEK